MPSRHKAPKATIARGSSFGSAECLRRGCVKPAAFEVTTESAAGRKRSRGLCSVHAYEACLKYGLDLPYDPAFDIAARKGGA